ncbi:MAG TPA: spermidine/putrescine ABC transporter substrate-binding protein [Acidimicrobiia bacterium]
MNRTPLRRHGNRDALLAMLATNRIDRREFLKRVGAGGVLMLGGPALLAACGGGDGASNTTGGASTSVVVDNWIEYIDCGDSCDVHPTIDRFTEQTGIAVDYREGVNSNEDWFGKYQPQMAAGQPLGIDLVILTDYMAARMIRLEYVEAFDHANIPNMANLAPALASPAFDPNRDYTLPWQSGFTGLAYDIDQTGRELTSLQDLLDPAFAGKVGLLEGYNDTVPLFLLMNGIEPQTASVDEYVAICDQIAEAIASGQIRQIYGNDYLDALLAGDLAVATGWSGDIVSNQESSPSLRFGFPEEGFMIWNDNMMIPKGAANKANAEAFMNFYYDPANAAELAAAIWYVSPVVGAKEAVADIAPELADSELIFPTEATLSNAHIVRAFTEEEEAVVNDAVAAAMGV